MARKEYKRPTEEQIKQWQEAEGPERWLPVVGWEGLYEVSSWDFASDAPSASE